MGEFRWRDPGKSRFLNTPELSFKFPPAEPDASQPVSTAARRHPCPNLEIEVRRVYANGSYVIIDAYLNLLLYKIGRHLVIYNIITRCIERYKVKMPRTSRHLAPTILPEDIVFILGAPRSGTTWLAAIFDSHKDILYRHEPDIAVRRRSIPYPCARTAIARFRGDARNYLLQLAGLCLRNTVRRPLLFRKGYRSTADTAIRLGRYGLLWLIAQSWRAADALEIADRIGRDTKPRLLIKSVSACGRAGLYAAALPEARFILIVRNPFGQVASMLRGTTLGHVDGYRATDRLWAWPEAGPYGLGRQHFETMPLVERLAWHWALNLEKALDDLAGEPNVRTVCYETLCARPQIVAERLFAFAGLAMGRQTLGFLRRSANARFGGSYFSVFKNAARSANRWRTDLSAAEQAAIRSIVERTRGYAAYGALLSADEPVPGSAANPPDHVVSRQRLGSGGEVDHADQHIGLVRVG